MARGFNIRNKDWDSSYPFYSFYSDSFIKIANSFELKISSPIHQVPTYHANNPNNVIDLIFLWLNSVKIDNYFILPDSQYSLDHTSLTIDISIIEEVIQEKRCTIIKNNKEEEFQSL